MQIEKSFGIHFFLKRYKERQNGTIPIYGRITVNGVSRDFSARRGIQDDRWSSKLGRANPKTTIAKTLNPYLDEVATEIKECYEEFLKNKEYVTAEKVKLRYLGLEESISTLNELIKYHRDEELVKLAPGTAKNYKATETYLARFLKSKLKTEDIALVQVNYALVIRFENYLRTCKPIRACQPLKNNGIMKHMERFQKIIGVGVTYEWISKDPFKRYQLKFEEYDADFLEDFEVLAFMTLESNNPRLQLSRDMFIFGCYTGLSYIEVKQLKKEDITVGIDGNRWIKVRRQKSKTQALVPLLEEAKKVLEKYKDFSEGHPEGLLLPTPSNVTLNRDVKELAGMAGIRKHLTFHVARHTFATTVTLLNEVPIETVSKLLGHKKLSTTRKYARVIEQKISRDMNNLKELLAKKEQTKYDRERTVITYRPHLRIIR